MSERSVILHEEITLSGADIESVVGSARTHFAIIINLHPHLKRAFFLEMGKKSPGGVPQQLVIGDHGETDEDAGR